MTTETNTEFAASTMLDEARAQLLLRNHREASRLYSEAAKSAIVDAATRIGFQLSRRRLYSDVCDMLEPWFTREHTFSNYCSMSLLETNAREDYDLGDIWMQELADDIHELFTMLEFAVSQNGN